MGRAGVYSNFPKALFRPNKEFIFKESLCERIQVTQSIENISLLTTTTLTGHKEYCNNYCCLYTHWTLYQHREENTWNKCCLGNTDTAGQLCWVDCSGGCLCPGPELDFLKSCSCYQPKLRASLCSMSMDIPLRDWSLHSNFSASMCKLQSYF